MIDREKVIKGLKECGFTGCAGSSCPYYPDAHCDTRLLEDAPALIHGDNDKAVSE